MTTLIHAHASHQAKAPTEAFTYTPDDLGLFGARIKITHCGVCHSDLHLLDGDWGGDYPMVVGHEIVGIVEAVGTASDPALIGKRVGIGWQRTACLHCEQCLQGNEQLCEESKSVCQGHYGGFAEAMIADSRFVHIIPDALDSVNAAPLLCAGITVYAPLRRYNVGVHSRVGVVGIGGLGHLALQFANRMGADVTAFTSSPSKAEEAKELGAQHVVSSTDDAELKKARGSLDLIIVTVTAQLDWSRYLKALRPNGMLCFVSGGELSMQLTPSMLVTNQWSITGSSIGGRGIMREMLDFSARAGIRTWTETLPMDSVNDALSRLRKNDVRYRFVLEQ